MEMIIVGIDVSKATLDVCVVAEKAEYYTISNRPADIRKFLKKLPGKNIILGVENTGRYNWALYEACMDLPLTLYVINPLHLKRSMGLVRGKTDKDDAYRIAVFVKNNHSQLPAWVPSSKAVQKLQILLSKRNQRVKTLKRLKAARNDSEMIQSMGLSDFDSELDYALADTLETQIKQIEKQIMKVIAEDPELKTQMELLLTVPGVGKILAWHLLAKTNGFKRIYDAKKLACYCGVVPFAHQSGTSLNRKPKVSSFADKNLKSILHMGAMSAIKTDKQLGEYYRRKVSEGKNKMSVLNAVRNKIIHRIAAVIKNQKNYQQNLILS
eukprot:TRINITY_DN4669_c0_g1_i1.p1 TRINITY_DN4669_c0_g1~~TRINITY_DN4669_c0_g1_i1.p1  ORF type:complete len:325 (-),score=38.80 TRINITY_DN4669_c0_g1_i1:54-1028(-)